mgnify:CR=1 FL=1
MDVHRTSGIAFAGTSVHLIHIGFSQLATFAAMKGSNAHELLSHEDIDGGLIGGASLDPKALMEIVHAANQE